MDRAQFILLGLPIMLFCSDIVHLFTTQPPKPTSYPQPQPRHQPKSQSILQQPLHFPIQNPSAIGGIGVGSTVTINFCTSCSYRGTAIAMKNMLEAAFPGINVILANHPPPLPKRLLSKVIPIVQVGTIGIIMAGEHIFPRLGFMTRPTWYYSLRANRFGSIASTLLMGNFFQSFLQSSGAFEVYCNSKLVFSKLKEHRFPGEVELRGLVGRQLANSRTGDSIGGGNFDVGSFF